MKRISILLSFALILLMAAGSVFASGGQQGGAVQPPGGTTQGYRQSVEEILALGTLPRNETLYFAGISWDPVVHFNPYNPSPATLLTGWQLAFSVEV